METIPETVLCYGFQIEPREGEDEITFEHLLARLAGIERPSDRFDDEKHIADPKHREAWIDYWSAKDHVVKEHEIALVRYGSREHPQYVLSARASILKVLNGKPIETKKLLTTLSMCRKDIHTFCEKAGIEFQEPELILCSFEG